MSSPGVLSGRLEEFRLVELLQVMGLSANTGALHLRTADGRTGLIYFVEGALVSCIELDTEALTLGHVLQQLNLVSTTQIEHAFHLQTQDPLGKRIGERLIELGYINEDQLYHALRTQALWTARELALWSAGTYEFHPGERLPAESTALAIDPTEVVMELLRFEHEWQSLVPYLRDGMRTHVAMAFAPPIDHPLSFHAAAWQVISRVNAHQTVRRIATALRQPEVEVARMIGPLVREGLLVPVGAAGGPGLPEEAERMSMHNFDLFTLLIGMEQEWLKRKTPADQLIALVGFINQTMTVLAEACQTNGLHLSPDTLATLLAREGLESIEGYQLVVAHNHINVSDFATFCHRVLEGTARGTTTAPKLFFDQAFDVLRRALAAAFQAINARVSSPIERVQNQEAWEALFATLRG